MLNRGVGVALLVVLGSLLVPAARAQDSCNRQCLQDIADRYLAALVAHDPTKAPLAATVRITENGQNLGTRHGLWKTAAGNATFRLYFADPQQGAVGFIGQLMENDSPVPVALRLKVVNGRVTQAETIVARNTPFAKADGFATPKPVLLADVPAADRVSREEMIRIADSYFTGLDTDHAANNVHFDPGCQRREDGNVTANSTDPKASAMQKLGCQAQFDTGFSVIVTKVRDRRYPIVDVERGLVYAQVFFDHNGTVASFKMNGKAVEVPADFRRPKSFQIGELFKIQKGRIRQIEAVVLDVPYGMKSGWGKSAVAGTAVSPPVPADCDHDCLVGFVDQYLAALLRHDPGKDLFAADARFTENAQPLPLGTALWQTASAGPHGYELVIADPQTGNVGFYILMQENGNPIWLSGRLKVLAGKITELETAIVRKGVSFGKFDRTAISPLWNQILKPDERRPRKQLIAIANKYFDALDHHLVDSVPFDADCFRVENGVQTAGPPVAPAAALAMGGSTAPAPVPSARRAGPNGRPLPDVGHTGCRGNINSNMWQYITQIQPRRCETVDVERGEVQCIVLFHQDGEVPGTNVPGYGYLKYSGATRRPFDTLIPEVFKVKNGKIVEIEATMPSLPFGSTTGWK
ncbi:MAG TPA: hypothetical protein VIY90_00865 [Steroidobacteraceae bacterium]